MATATSTRVTLFEDIFSITALNPEGKKFERVNRLAATGTTFECDLLLDYNCQIYTNLHEGSKITLVLASTLNLDGSPDDHGSYTPQTTVNGSSASSVAQQQRGGSSKKKKSDRLLSSSSTASSTIATLADNYEYVMHGRVFDISYGKENVIEIAISFGGLLCRLTGDQRHLCSILPDMRLYLLVKKD
jgi:DNA-directed RNA polymerase I, II, and III subunit RPABC3